MEAAMSTQATSALVYPDTDGEPLADNTKQFQWIMMLQGNLEAMLPDAFVAGDLLWYPSEGKADIRQAPDVLIAFGRPRGHRGSYRQWEEGNIIPQVVFEILSPGNRAGEMQRKLEFYERYGVEEYYLYDPEDFYLSGWIRDREHLRLIDPIDGFISPRLGVRFLAPGDSELVILRPDGSRFLTFLELSEVRDQEQQRTARLAAKLRELGVDPDTL
jgi:Uma2 family endonuclease